MKTDLDIARGLRRKSDDDFEAISLLLAASVPPSTICFHAQQGAEKMLKALMLASGMTPPRIHDLVRLAAALSPLQPSLMISKADLRVLNPYGIATRYLEEVSPDRPGAEAAAAIAERIREAVATSLSTILGDDPTEEEA